MDCLIPARKNSKRIPNKNLKPLAGKPLILWALQNAFDSEVFENVWISTDSAEVAELAVSYTGCKHIQRPAHMAEDDSPDIDWVKHALGTIEHREHSQASVCAPCSLGRGHWGGREVALIRPTSPFLGPETIQRAQALWDDIKGEYHAFGDCERCEGTVSQEGRCRSCGETYRLNHYHSMRAIRRAQEHPMKQHQYDPETHELYPWLKNAYHQHLHSRPTQTLADSWVQSAGLEMFWARVPIETGTIAGSRMAGFVVDGPAALDLNTERDWAEAEQMCQSLELRSAYDTGREVFREGLHDIGVLGLDGGD